MQPDNVLHLFPDLGERPAPEETCNQVAAPPAPAAPPPPRQLRLFVEVQVVYPEGSHRRQAPGAERRLLLHEAAAELAARAARAARAMAILTPFDFGALNRRLRGSA